MSRRARRPRPATARPSRSPSTGRSGTRRVRVLPHVGEQPFALGVDVCCHVRERRRRPTPRSESARRTRRAGRCASPGRAGPDARAVRADRPGRRTEIAERRAGCQRAVDEGAAAALRGDLPPDDDFRGRPAARRRPRTAAESSPVRTRSADARPPTSSPTAPTRMDLPAPVSPVSDVQAGLEFELEAVDDGQIADLRGSGA